MHSENLTRQLELLPNYLSHHLVISLAALFAGIFICLPLAFVATRIKWLQSVSLTFASIMQTIPGIALLALMVPLLGMIGFLPAFIALVLYSMLPVLRNTVTGILTVDPSVIEAARGIGMTTSQILFQVEVPLALPVIVAGIRTAAVWVVGTATLSTPVGATSLGNYIFGGLQTQNSTAVIVGCTAAAVLAIVLDRLIRWLELAASGKGRRYAYGSGAGLAVIAVFGFAPFVHDALSKQSDETIVIGAKPFTEQYILAEALRIRLEDAGMNAVVKSSLGSTVLFDALATGEIDCAVDYTGTLWANVMKRSDLPSRETIQRDLTHWLKDRHALVSLGALGFENTYALAMSSMKSAGLGISSLEDLARHSSKLRMGSDYEFFSRPEWTQLKSNYGFQFSDLRVMDPTLMYAAIRHGEVDIISAYSTDGRIANFNLVVLDDTRGALPPYDALLLLSARAAENHAVVTALSPLIQAIDDNTMRRANGMVDVHRKPVEVAAGYLLDQIGIVEKGE